MLGGRREEGKEGSARKVISKINTADDERGAESGSPRRGIRQHPGTEHWHVLMRKKEMGKICRRIFLEGLLTL